jgi:oligopeptidase B
MSVEAVRPPHAERKPVILRLHGDEIVDEFAWLENRDDPAVIAYLEAENTYAEAVMAPAAPLREQLYAEMRGRIKEEDRSVAVPRGRYRYYSRTEAGAEYPVMCRTEGDDGLEEVVLDLNTLAIGHAFCQLGAYEPSPNQHLLAYGLDTTGSIIFTLFIKDLTTGALLDTPIERVNEVQWADDRTLFYTVFDDAHRAYRLYRHVLGTSPADDALIYEETDERFSLSLRRTRSGAYLLLTSYSHGGTEVRYVSTATPFADWQVIYPRRPKIDYFVDHHGDYFYIRTNDGAENFRLIRAPISDPTAMIELVPGRVDVLIDHFDCFADYLVVYERRDGLRQIRISTPDGDQVRYVSFPEPVYTCGPHENKEFATDRLRLSYSSLITPPSVVEYNMRTGSWQVVKQEEIPSGYDPSRYVSERLTATAPDGARVPISLVYRRDRPRNGGPCLLVGYGSYGYSYEPSFDSKRLSLLDRGFVVAIAHIRGGQELGRRWYEQGRMLHKPNTFSDFIACAEHLIAAGYTSPRQLAISGRSAGGLLMAAVVNARPDLFQAVVAGVPFTNVIIAMLKPDLPLTVTEWEQWGNPAIEAEYRVMRSYDPYLNVKPGPYPHILATAGLHDLQVPYWDPAKWVAKLRTVKTNDTMLLLRTNMQAGHSGHSGRFARLTEFAWEYAFILTALGIAS